MLSFNGLSPKKFQFVMNKKFRAIMLHVPQWDAMLGCDIIICCLYKYL